MVHGFGKGDLRGKTMIVSTTHKRKFNEDLLSESFETKCFLGKDKGTTPEALDILARDPSWWGRDFVAGNKNTSIDTLKKLYKDKDFRIRNSVECNPVWKKFQQEHSVDGLIECANKKVIGRKKEVNRVENTKIYR